MRAYGIAFSKVANFGILTLACETLVKLLLSKNPASNLNLHFQEIYSSFKIIITQINIITSYLTNSCIVFTLKMESVFINAIFGLKMMVKSGQEKTF